MNKMAAELMGDTRGPGVAIAAFMSALSVG